MPNVTEDMLKKSKLLQLVNKDTFTEKELCEVVDQDHVLCGTHLDHQAMGRLSSLAKMAMETAATKGKIKFVEMFIQQCKNKVDLNVKKEAAPLFFLSPCYFGAAFCLAIENGHLDIAKKLHESRSIVLYHNIQWDEVYLVNKDGSPYTKTARDLVKETGNADFIKHFEATCVPSFQPQITHSLFSISALKVDEKSVVPVVLSAAPSNR